MKKLLTFFAAVLPCALAFAVPHIPAQPVIDGKLTDAVWKNLPWKSSFAKLGKTEQAPVQTRFKSFNDGKKIYFAIECDEPDTSKLVRKSYSDGSGLLWMNDSVEINLIPDSKLLTFYKTMIDANGVHTDLRGQDDNTDSGRYLFSPWRSSMEVKVRILKNKWIVEAAIPFGSMNYIAANNEKWRLNIGRNRWVTKKVELSGWSVMPEPNHVIPKAFREVTVEKFSPVNYLYDMEEFKGEIVRKNGKQSYKVSTTIHNNSGSFRIFQMECSLTDRKTGKVYQGKSKFHLQGRAYRKYSVMIPDVPNGDYLFNWDLNTNSASPALLKRMTRTVNIEFIPLQVTLKRPAYRNNLYATMPDKTIEAVIDLRESKGLPLTVTLSGEGVNEVRKIAKSIGRNVVIFDGAKLKDGRYVLKATIEKDGKELAASVKIRKLPYRKGEVWVDGRGVTHVDGKEFFSYGWYQSHGERNPVYNTHVNMARFKNIDSAKKSVSDSYKIHGLKSLILPFQDLANRSDWSWVIFKDPDTRKKGLTKQQREKIIEFVSQISDQEGLLGYYMADEPEARDNNPAWYEEARELIAEIDPYHPCLLLNYGIEGIRKYYKGCDILLPDCYPQYFEDGSTSSPRWRPSDFAKVSTSLRPAWQMPLISPWPDLSRDGKLRGIAPTYFDQRSQIFQAIIHNVKGINNYAFFDSQRFSDSIIGPPEIGKILMNASRYLLDTTVPDGVKITTTPHFGHFQVGLKMPDGKICLLAINTSMQKLKVDFVLKKKFSGKLYLEGGKKSVKVVNGKFSDVFAPNETRIYFSDNALASSLTPVADTLKAIEDLRKSRKKPGNLVGLGDMYSIEYQRYGKEKKLAPGVPQITASSDARYYMTRETGSLYYLVDGLTAPNRVEYTWKPGPGDKKPFVQFKLSKPAALKMVKLYTLNGNLKAGQIVVNGKSFPFANKSGKTEITVPLSGVNSDTVRIECTEFNTKSSDPFGFTGRLLSEVEIY